MGERIRLGAQAVTTRFLDGRQPVEASFASRSFSATCLRFPPISAATPGIGDAARLMRAYPDEFLYFPFIPVSVQRALAVPLSKLGTASQ